MMLLGTTTPTSVTHCYNVFGDADSTDTTATAAEKILANLYRGAFDYVYDQAEAADAEDDATTD